MKKNKKDNILIDSKLIKEIKNSDEDLPELYEVQDQPDKEDSNCLLKIVTSQCQPIKTIIETLNGLMTNAIFCFNKDGIKLTDINSLKSLVINLELERKNFEIFECQEEGKIISIKLSKFYRIINSIGTNNVLTMSIYKHNPNSLSITNIISEKGETTTYMIDLLEPKNSEIEKVPNENEYPFIVELSSNFFLKKCRDAAHNTNFITFIRGNSDNIILEFEADGVKQETIIKTGKGTLKIAKNDNKDEIIQGIFSLKDIITFSKCTNISDTAKICLSNKYPLMIEYTTGNLGKIQLFLHHIKIKK